MTDSLLLALEVGGAVMLGASTQRLTGIGFALVSSPLLVVILGPLDGVIVVNAFSAITALAVFLQVFRRVNYRRAITMAIPAMIAIVPGSWVARTAQPDVLGLVIAVLIIAALTVSLRKQGLGMLSGRAGPPLAGAVSGFMNVTAGVGGPAFTAYALATHWEQRSFAATAQLYFFLISSTSLLAKGTVPHLDSTLWVGGVAGLIVGMLGGTVLESRVPHHVTRVGVIVVAYLGAILILGKSLFAMIGG